MWLWVMIDLCQTVPQQYLLSCLAGWRAKDMIPIRTTLLACLSIAAAFALNLVLFAVLNILLWAGWAAGLVTHYQHWPSTEVAVTLIPPFLTGLIAGWTKSFYRPYVSAPCSMILFGAALAFSDPRAPWLPALAYFLLVGAACEIGCYCAQKLAPRLQPPATAQQSLSG
ncbi:MAG TPA: hypothetical protein VHV08_07610 [Pirellulales bacterium]|nr:hypothetical protein [Pirellulales bacterium]